MMVCSLFGHRNCPGLNESHLLAILEDLIEKEQTDRFLVGGQGSFDRIAQKALFQLKQKHRHITCLEVLAYIPGRKQEWSPPDRLETIYPDGLEAKPRKYAILERNRWMVRQSDVIVCYVVHFSGGAAQAVEYAIHQKKRIINLAEALAD